MGRVRLGLQDLRSSTCGCRSDCRPLRQVHHIQVRAPHAGLASLLTLGSPFPHPRPAFSTLRRRENITAQYLSWKTAEETDCWETTPAEQAANPACAEKVTTLGKDWPDFQERVRAWYNVSETACRKAGKPVEFISMEKYLAPKWQTYAQEVARMRVRVEQP